MDVTTGELQGCSRARTEMLLSRDERLQRIRRQEWIALSLLLAATLLFGLNFRLVRVEGASMQPTYRSQDVLLLWRLAAPLGSYHVGDVIVFRGPDGDEYIKRIAFLQDAQGGRRMPSRLWTPQGLISVRVLALSADRNDFPGYQHDINAAKRGIPVRRTIYVMGDNTWNSEDSRDFGPIAPDQVIGRVVARVYHAPTAQVPPVIAHHRPARRVAAPNIGPEIERWHSVWAKKQYRDHMMKLHPLPLPSALRPVVEQ